MADLRYMPIVKLGGWKFHLLWNSRALVEWSSEGDLDREIDLLHPDRVAGILTLMGREAAAVLRSAGYEAEEVPPASVLEGYLLDAPVYELRDAILSVNAAFSAGNRRDYDPDSAEGVDVDTIELKKP